MVQWIKEIPSKTKTCLPGFIHGAHLKGEREISLHIAVLRPSQASCPRHILLYIIITINKQSYKIS